LTSHSRSSLHVRPARRVSWTRLGLPRVQPCSPRRTSCPARPLPSAGIAPLPRYYGPICQPWGHGGRSSSVLCFRYSSCESPKAFPSSFTYPFPGMPRSQTPAASPAQSPYPTPTDAFPILDTVGHCTISVTGLDHFTLVAACRSLCLRFVMLVALHDAKLDCHWLARPWRRRNCTSWIDEASSGRTQCRVRGCKNTSSGVGPLPVKRAGDVECEHDADGEGNEACQLKPSTNVGAARAGGVKLTLAVSTTGR
jgi:hypothetical protein